MITLLTIENNIINNYFVTFELRVMVTAFAILAMFYQYLVYSSLCIFVFVFVFVWKYGHTQERRWAVWRVSLPMLSGRPHLRQSTPLPPTTHPNTFKSTMADAEQQVR